MESSKYIHTTDVHNTRAAEEIVPILMEWFHPKSVVDVGCGLGTWLYVFKTHGVTEVLGIEGNHLKTDLLAISKAEILLTDLEQEFIIDKKFDLAISLEVAEHLSSDSASQFIDSLTKLSNIIVFSAAIPNQGGQNHINEQWISYWQSIFTKHDFTLSDEIRAVFWNNDKIEWWYKQNMILAIKNGTLLPFKEMKPPLNLVHPDLFTIKISTINSLLEINSVNKHSINIHQMEIEKLENENRLLKNKLDTIESELKTIYNSNTWIFARKFIIIPITVIKKFLKINLIPIIICHILLNNHPFR